MIEHVYLYSQGFPVDSPFTLDQMFAWNIRFQVIVDNDEQHDYLYALQLMYGREIQIDTWDMWSRPVPSLTFSEKGMDIGKMQRKLLPMVFTTSKRELRGL